MKSRDKVVLYQGNLVDERLVVHLKSDHRSFSAGFIAPARIFFGWLGSNLSTRPVGYGLGLGEFFEATWSRGSAAYRTGFALFCALPLLCPVGLFLIALLLSGSAQLLRHATPKRPERAQLPPATRRLLDDLDSPSWCLWNSDRLGIATRLAESGTEAILSVPHLARVVQDDRRSLVRAGATFALSRILSPYSVVVETPRSATDAQRQVRACKEAVERAYAEPPSTEKKAAVKAIVKAVEDARTSQDKKYLQPALVALVEVAPFGRDCFDALSDWVSDEDRFVALSSRAVLANARREDDGIVGQVTEVLADAGSDPHLRHGAGLLLLNLYGVDRSPAIETLTKLLAEEPEAVASHCQPILQYLLCGAKSGSDLLKSVLPRILSALERNPRQAAEVLWYIGEAAVDPLVETLKRSKSDEVKLWVSSTLGWIGPPAARAVPALRELRKVLDPENAVSAAIQKIVGI